MNISRGLIYESRTGDELNLKFSPVSPAESETKAGRGKEVSLQHFGKAAVSRLRICLSKGTTRHRGPE